MHHTLSRLLSNDPTILDCYSQAKDIWSEIWKSSESETVDGLALLLSSRQGSFEILCGAGDREVGKEVMVLSGFGITFPIGGDLEDEEKGRMLNIAFKRSTCSGEVKGLANRIGAVYHYE